MIIWVRLRRWLSVLALDNNVTFHGFLPVQEVVRYIAGADLGVVPNRLNEATHFMLPLKLLEYALMDVAVIAARLEAVEYYFGSDAVRYFKSGDAADLAIAIEELYRRPEVRAALARRGREAIEAISWDKQCKEFYEALDSVLAIHRLRTLPLTPGPWWRRCAVCRAWRCGTR